MLVKTFSVQSVFALWFRVDNFNDKTGRGRKLSPLAYDTMELNDVTVQSDKSNKKYASN